MKRTLPLWLATLFAAAMLTGCVVEPGPLPPIVEFDEEPYYYHGGFHYYFRDNAWYYSHARNGPWKPLPLDRYPKETRFKGRNHGPEHERGHNERDRG